MQAPAGDDRDDFGIHASLDTSLRRSRCFGVFFISQELETTRGTSQPDGFAMVCEGHDMS